MDSKNKKLAYILGSISVAYIVVLLFIFFPLPSNDPEWSEEWGSNNLEDWGRDIAVDSNNDIYVIGSSTPSIDSNKMGAVVKFDEHGDLLWERFFGETPSTEFANDLVIDKDNNLYITGTKQNNSNTLQDAIILKYDNNGTCLWKKVWGDNGENRTEKGESIALDSNNNIYIAGILNQSVNEYNLFLAKFDSEGNQIWNQTWGNEGYDHCGGITINSEGYIYLCGYNDDNGDLFLMKFDSYGNLKVEKTWGGEERDQAEDICIDTNDNILICGSTWNNDNGNSEVLVLKYNDNDALEWSRTFGRESNDFGSALITDSDGNVYVIGMGTNFLKNNHYHILLVKFDEEGNFQYYGLSTNHPYSRGYGIAINSHKDVLLLGFSFKTAKCIIMTNLPPFANLRFYFNIFTFLIIIYATFIISALCMRTTFKEWNLDQTFQEMDHLIPDTLWSKFENEEDLLFKSELLTNQKEKNWKRIIQQTFLTVIIIVICLITLSFSYQNPSIEPFDDIPGLLVFLFSLFVIMGLLTLTQYPTLRYILISNKKIYIYPHSSRSKFDKIITYKLNNIMFISFFKSFWDKEGRGRIQIIPTYLDGIVLMNVPQIERVQNIMESVLYHHKSHHPDAKFNQSFQTSKKRYSLAKREQLYLLIFHLVIISPLTIGLILMFFSFPNPFLLYMIFFWLTAEIIALSNRRFFIFKKTTSSINKKLILKDGRIFLQKLTTEQYKINKLTRVSYNSTGRRERKNIEGEGWNAIIRSISISPSYKNKPDLIFGPVEDNKLLTENVYWTLLKGKYEKGYLLTKDQISGLQFKNKKEILALKRNLSMKQ